MNLHNFFYFYDMIAVVCVKQRHRENPELLNGSSSPNGTKLDLIYALGTVVFHFEWFYIHPTARRKKKSIYLETRKLKTNLDVR